MLGSSGKGLGKFYGRFQVEVPMGTRKMEKEKELPKKKNIRYKSQVLCAVFKLL